MEILLSFIIEIIFNIVFGGINGSWRWRVLDNYVYNFIAEGSYLPPQLYIILF